MSTSQGHFELSSCFGSVSLFSYKKIYEYMKSILTEKMRFEFCVLGGMQNSSYLFSLTFLSRVKHGYGRPTVTLTPRQSCSRHAQGHVTLALKIMPWG